MSRVVAYLAVFVSAGVPWLEVLLVVPAALVAGLSPIPVVIVATAGNVLTLIPVVLAGDALRERLRRRRRRREVPQPRDHATAARSTGAQGRGRRLFDRFGLPGLALLGPLVSGIHVAALAAIGGGAPRRATLVWLSAGVAVWSIAAALLTLLGLDLFVDPDRLPELF
jgi:Ca2+/H+ antiporter, TMEM165/GDT1 family